MRKEERIDPFIDEVIPDRMRDVIVDAWHLPEPYKEVLESILEIKEEIRSYWKKNPDLRFSQVLIGFGFPNFPGTWFYMEEDEILEKID